MKLKFKILFIILTIVTGCSEQNGLKNPANRGESAMPGPASSELGGEKGNGADDHWIGENSAWFADPNRTIRFCIEANAEFPFDDGNLEQKIKTAFDTWARYMEAKQVGYAYSETELKMTRYFLSIKNERLPKCDGSEDLRFLFGTQSKEMEENLKFLSTSWSYAKRMEYDSKTRWGKGYIWFRSSGQTSDVEEKTTSVNWQEPGTLETIILHELGHIYGIGHVEGTIMRQDIVAWVRELPSIKKALERELLTQEIDQDKELAECLRCATTYKGVLSEYREPEEGIENFRVLTGRSPKGNIRASVRRSKMNKNVVLTIADDSDSMSFPLKEIQNSNSEQCSRSEIFKVLILQGSQDAREAGYDNSSCVSSLASITTMDGVSITVQILHNTSISTPQPPFGYLLLGRLAIKRVDSDMSKYLFISTY